jgi:hypothetical protein
VDGPPLIATGNTHIPWFICISSAWIVQDPPINQEGEEGEREERREEKWMVHLSLRQVKSIETRFV